MKIFKYYSILKTVFLVFSFYCVTEDLYALHLTSLDSMYINEQNGNLGYYYDSVGIESEEMIMQDSMQSYYEDSIENALLEEELEQQRLQRKIEERKRDEKQKMSILTISLYVLFSLGFIPIFVYSYNRIGTKNKQARKWFYYISICLIAAFGAMGIGEICESENEEILPFLLLCYLPLIVINSLLAVFIIRRTNEEYRDYYLIPDRFAKLYNLSSEFKKRIVMVFLIYPLFVIVPIPVAGAFVFLFYILPVLCVLGLLWIVSWILEGKKLDTKKKAEISKSRLYCRYCGRLIDADSDFCRYCGKKL